MAKAILKTGKGGLVLVEGVGMIGTECDNKLAVFQEAFKNTVSTVEKEEYYQNEEMNTLKNYEYER
jgi:hypothetical protein